MALLVRRTSSSFWSAMPTKRARHHGPSPSRTTMGMESACGKCGRREPRCGWMATLPCDHVYCVFCLLQEGPARCLDPACQKPYDPNAVLARHAPALQLDRCLWCLSLLPQDHVTLPWYLCGSCFDAFALGTSKEDHLMDRTLATVHSLALRGQIIAHVNQAALSWTDFENLLAEIAEILPTLTPLQLRKHVLGFAKRHTWSEEAQRIRRELPNDAGCLLAGQALALLGTYNGRRNKTMEEMIQMGHTCASLVLDYWQIHHLAAWPAGIKEVWDAEGEIPQRLDEWRPQRIPSSAQPWL